MTWKPVRVKKVSDLERIAKAERRVVRAADSLVKVNLTGEFNHICNTCVCVERLIAAVSALHRARKAKK